MNLIYLISIKRSKIDYLYGSDLTHVQGIPLENLSFERLILNLSDQDHPIITNHHNSNFSQVSRSIVWDPLEIIICPDNRFASIQELIDYIPNRLNHIQDLLGRSDKPQIESIIGYYGYLGFEFSRYLENYQHRSDKAQIPDLYFIFPKKYFLETAEEIVYLELSGEVTSYGEFTRSDETTQRFQFQMPINHYLRSLSEILNQIRQGEIYQTNFTHQFRFTTDRDPILSYLDLIQTHPTSHHAYLSNPHFSLMSISPELFLHVAKGEVVSKPIKGTITRGLTYEDDEKNKITLLNSEKDTAELSMIVDLLRNDLGRSVLPGSVEVEGHAILESYSNVHHLVSIIKGKIKINPQDSWKLLLRAFPGGSISGVPKLRALEILEKYETVPRGVYTGSIGYISISGDMEFNIAIRTLTQIGMNIFCSSGGGITVDSDPWNEFVETVHKVKHLFSYYGFDLMSEIVWYNGTFSSRSEWDALELEIKNIGFFETIRVENSIVHGFERHWSRIERGLKFYNLNSVSIMNVAYNPEELKYFVRSTIDSFAKLNLHQISRLRLRFFMTDTWNVILEMFRYETPKEISLILWDNEFKSPDEISAGIKPLNYSAYAKLTKIAEQAGYWDMLLQKNGCLLETSKASLLYKIHGVWYTTSNVIRGTIRDVLLAKGISERDLKITEMPKVEQFAVCNAMIKAIEVNSIYTMGNTLKWQKGIENGDIDHFRTIINDS